MAIVKWKRDGLLDPVSELTRLQDEINRLFDLDFAPISNGLFDRRVSPPVDITESDEEFTVTCDLPGVDQKNLDISIAGNVLTIKGEKKGVDTEKDRRVFKRETWSGTFQRTLSLPETVDTEKIDATMKDGVLTISFPRREEVKPRQISIKLSK
jgi:HSP20 family protein